jgi:hypothetical protein
MRLRGSDERFRDSGGEWNAADLAADLAEREHEFQTLADDAAESWSPDDGPFDRAAFLEDLREEYQAGLEALHGDEWLPARMAADLSAIHRDGLPAPEPVHPELDFG